MMLICEGGTNAWCWYCSMLRLSRILLKFYWRWGCLKRTTEHHSVWSWWAPCCSMSLLKSLQVLHGRRYFLTCLSVCLWNHSLHLSSDCRAPLSFFQNLVSEFNLAFESLHWPQNLSVDRLGYSMTGRVCCQNVPCVHSILPHTFIWYIRKKKLVVDKSVKYFCSVYSFFGDNVYFLESV